MRAEEDEVFGVGAPADDGVFRIAGVASADEAIRNAQELSPGAWRFHEEVHVCFIEYEGKRDEIWDECAADEPGAVKAWRLLDAQWPEITLDANEWIKNPLYEEKGE